MLYTTEQLNKAGMFELMDYIEDLKIDLDDLRDHLSWIDGSIEDELAAIAQDRIEPEPSWEFQSQCWENAKKLKASYSAMECELIRIGASLDEAVAILDKNPDYIRFYKEPATHWYD